MKKNDTEQEMLRQFTEFIEADPTAPSRKTDEVVLRMVAKDLRPALGKVFAKLSLIEGAAGLMTLTLCPQFGLGFGAHNEIIHRLHAGTIPVVFYLLCGVLFVTIGSALGGLVLTRNEIRAVSQTVNYYFTLYSVLAYLFLVVLGPEVFVASSLTWIVGAMLGNFLGYGAIIHLRHAGFRR